MKREENVGRHVAEHVLRDEEGRAPEERHRDQGEVGGEHGRGSLSFAAVPHPRAPRMRG